MDGATALTSLPLRDLGCQHLFEGVLMDAVYPLLPHHTKPIELAGSTCFHYLIEGADRYKIGRTWADPDKRLAALQIGSPVTLLLVAYFRHHPAIERKLHNEFDSLRVHGEWFVKSPEILERFLHIQRSGSVH